MKMIKQLLTLLFWVIWVLFFVLLLLVVFAGGEYDLGEVTIGDGHLGLFLLFFCAFYLLQEHKTPRKARAANLCLVFASILFALLAGEIGIRHYLQRTQGFNPIQQLHDPDIRQHTRRTHPLLHISQFSTSKGILYELKPHLDLQFGYSQLRTNSVGIRSDREFSQGKAPGVRRIVGIGDSGMWGWDTNQGQNYLEILEKELNKRENEPSVEVLNMAVPGYNTYQEYMTLKLKGLDYHPDIVVIGWCSNDYMLPFYMYSRKNHWRQKNSFVYNLLLDRPRFFRMMAPEVALFEDLPEKLIDREVIDHSGEEGVRKSLEAILRLSREHAFNVVLFGLLTEDIQRICREVGMPMINSLELEKENPPEECMIYYMHPTPCGHEILGGFLAEKLQELGWL